MPCSTRQIHCENKVGDSALKLCENRLHKELRIYSLPSQYAISPLYLILGFQEVEENNKYSRSKRCMS